MTKLKLTVNETKTRVCKLPEEKFDFLGYTFGRCYSPKTGRAYLGTTPSKKRVQRICQAISEATRRNKTQQAVEQIVAQCNGSHCFRPKVSGHFPGRILGFLFCLTGRLRRLSTRVG